MSLQIAKSLRRHLIFGANTDVGKTIISAGLIRTAQQQQQQQQQNNSVHYIKPLQSGVDNSNEGDAAFVEKVCRDMKSNSNNTSTACSSYETLFQWKAAVSPHLASRLEQKPTSDEQVLGALYATLNEHDTANYNSTTVIETAGGALSPSSASPDNNAYYHANYVSSDACNLSGNSNNWGWSTQADLYQATRLPAVLIGDGRLGGIACTLSTLESLLVRGYDVHAIVMIHDDTFTTDHHSNAKAMREYLSNRGLKMRSGGGAALFEFENSHQEIVSLPPLPPMPEPLDDWYENSEVVEKFQMVHEVLDQNWHTNVDRINKLQAAGRGAVWWPFTQHGSITADEQVTLIDAAHGDHFLVIKNNDTKSNKQTNKQRKERVPLFDACASWWTQGVGHGESSMAIAAASAAGRYGHVIFPDAVHDPAVSLAERLLSEKGPGHNWASRVFYSDDGSTAIEVGIKMAMKRYAVTHDTAVTKNLVVLAQEDCYHGDTLGCMDVAVPSVYNEGQHPWYQPRGLFLETPTLGFVDGTCQILNSNYISKNDLEFTFNTIAAAMDVSSRLTTPLYKFYKAQISAKWDAFEESSQQQQQQQNIILDSNPIIGCVVIEPILMGAGGMKFIDPLWQRALVDEARHRRIPVLFDEIASGMLRLGHMSNKDVLGVAPDVACYAKLLTGGLVPLSATLATDDVFQAFYGEEKSQALLHGHSYTAHPVGCAASLHALDAYDAILLQQSGKGKSKSKSKPSYFIESEVQQLSMHALVSESFALGTVLAVKLAGQGTGYTAVSASKPVVEELRRNGVFARPLGNVVYIMVSPFTKAVECQRLLTMLKDAIDFVAENGSGGD